MGLFDMFKSDAGQQMSPHLAFATSLIYMMGADGEMDNEEVGHLLSVLGGQNSGGTIGVGAQNRDLLRQAQQIARSKPVDQFISEISPILSDAQKMCVLMNLIDSSLADGQPEPEEQVLFGKFMNGFGITEQRFKPFFEALVLKNDRTIFINPDHPQNSPGHQVRLSL
jgi:uncharacterized tellurite resistance protein B-like protein